MTAKTDLALDQKALALFVVLTVIFCTATYVPMLASPAGFDALGGYALLLLMWSPGTAGVITALLVYRSLRPLGLTGNRRAIFWVLVCIAIPIAYALLTKGVLAATGVINLGTTGLAPALLYFGMFLSLRTAVGEELG